MDSSLDSSRPGVFVPIQDGKQNCRYVEYLGDPELQPVRSNEITFLVRVLYQLCNYFNRKYQNELVTAYNRNDFLGRIARQIVKPPTTVVSLPKRGPNGFTSGCETRIPPRLSFRIIAGYNFLGSLLLGILLFWIMGYGTTLFLGFSSFSWLVYILVRATCESWLRSDSTAARRSAYSFSPH